MLQRTSKQFFGLCLTLCVSINAAAVDAPSCPEGFADTPGIPVHLELADIEPVRSVFSSCSTARHSSTQYPMSVTAWAGRPPMAARNRAHPMNRCSIAYPA